MANAFTTNARLTLSADEVAVALGISRAKVYELIRTGDIPSVRLGRRIVVPWRRLDDLLHSTVTPDPEPTCTCGRITASDQPGATG